MSWILQFDGGPWGWCRDGRDPVAGPVLGSQGRGGNSPRLVRRTPGRTLLRILVSRRGAFVSREYLTEALWPTAPPANPAMNINVLVQRARRALCDPGLVLTAPGGYSFAGTSGCRVDAESFLQSVDTARRLLAGGRGPEALSAYRRALCV